MSTFRTSTIPDYIDTLLDVLRLGQWPEFPNDASVQVLDGWPATDQLLRRYVVVDDTNDENADTQSWAMLGNGRKDETYTLFVLIGVRVPGLTMPIVRRAVFDMLGVVEHVVRGIYTPYPNGAPNPTLGVAGVTSAQLRRGPHAQEWTNEGPRAGITAAIEVTAQLARIT